MVGVQFLPPITGKTAPWLGIVLEHLTNLQVFTEMLRRGGGGVPESPRVRAACQAGRLSPFSPAQLS